MKLHNNFDYRGLGVMLQTRREQLKLSHQDFAKAIDVSVSFLEKLEAGNLRQIPIEPMIALCALFEISFDDFQQFALTDNQ